jgi:hypothetical protein
MNPILANDQLCQGFNTKVLVCQRDPHNYASLKSFRSAKSKFSNLIPNKGR